MGWLVDAKQVLGHVFAIGCWKATASPFDGERALVVGFLAGSRRVEPGRRRPHWETEMHFSRPLLECAQDPDCHSLIDIGARRARLGVRVDLP